MERGYSAADAGRGPLLSQEQAMGLQSGFRQVFKNVELAKILNDLKARQTQEEASKKLQQYLA